MPLHVSPAPDRHGKTRLRFRKGLYSTYLHAPLDTEEFWQEYQAALAGVKAATQRIGSTRHKPGSIAALALAYYQSPEFIGLRDSTKAVRRGIIDRFVKTAGPDPVRMLERKHVKAIIGAMSSKPHAANNLLKALRLLLDFAVDIELIERNPARGGVKGFKIGTKGFTSWSEAQIAAYEKAHPIGTRARLAMALLLYTGQRRGDVIRMGWQHVQGNRIAVQQAKTGARLSIKIHKALADALAHTVRTNLTFLVTEKGAPFTAAGFGNLFREWCDKAGLHGLSAHGLRKAAARRVADAGRSTKQIQAVTGHATLQEVELYTRAADQAKLNDEAIDSMPDRSDREHNFPNRKRRLDKTPRKALK
ncbi:tyrosine-type recombinase/integrase [Mesorhizobium sp.]|uniref:site-specific integrase n=1 Tax=Mesorhizobium sp. TaxID=1871066 RepID=UPI0025BBC9D7|nr:tyrosine-type recombinase/integrase [Mesorhizobium sp.]